MPPNTIRTYRKKFSKENIAEKLAWFYLAKFIIIVLMPFYKKKFQSGQLLIEVMIATAIFAILSAAIISLVVLLYQTVADVRIKTIARHLAVQQMELLNNVTYNSLGTTHGIPIGSIPEFSTVNRNGFIFTIHTSVIYVDDPFDNLAPQDLLPTDYKQVRIEIEWDQQLGLYHEPIVLVNLISPKGIETTGGGGTLSVFVINSLGTPVGAATVHITNSKVNPNIDIELQTDQNGFLILPGAPPCSACYNISVNKSGYSTDKTYTSSEIANPNKAPLTVTTNSLTESTFMIDILSSLKLTSFSGAQNFVLSPNNTFRLTGAKTIGLDSQDNPVYKFDQTLSTGSDATLLLPNIEWDTYILTIPPSFNKQISGIYPHQPMLISPKSQTNLSFSTVALTSNSLLFNLQDASGSAIASASAVLKLSNIPVATISSGLSNQPNFGQAFFNNLNNANYAFTITHPVYQNLSGSIAVNGYTNDTLIMTKK